MKQGQELEQNGYTIIPNILSVEERKQLLELFIDDLSEINTELNTDNIKTLSDLFNLKKDVDYPSANFNRLLGEYGLCQGNACWYIRTNKTIQNKFAQALGTKELVCSMDSIGFSSSDCECTRVNWLHVDQFINQGPYLSSLTSYQGIYYYSDVVNDEYATTMVVPGTHKQDRYTSSEGCSKLFNNALKLKVHANSLLIFNSKLVHQGWYGKNRLAFMISYGNINDRTEQVRQRKVMFYINGWRSNHWSQLATRLGFKYNVRLEDFDRSDSEFVDLNPQFTRELTLDDMKLLGSPIYQKKMDELIPPKRLALL